LKVPYTEEAAAADIVQAITYLNERNPTAARQEDDRDGCPHEFADGVACPGNVCAHGDTGATAGGVQMPSVIVASGQYART
jgi:hypothetical protein